MSTLSPVQVDAFRLIEHELQPSGQCQVCASAWPCPVVATIHAFVKDPQRQFVAVLERARNEA